jgi:hypothetical protein
MMRDPSLPTHVEETPQEYANRRNRTLSLSVILLTALGLGVVLVYWATARFVGVPGEDLPTPPSLSVLMIVFVIIPISVSWIAVLQLMYDYFRMTPVRITQYGIEMPIVPFRRWWRGDRAAFVRWEDIQLLGLDVGTGETWGAVLRDGSGHVFRVHSVLFGNESDVALRLLRAGMRRQRNHNR